MFSPPCTPQSVYTPSAPGRPCSPLCPQVWKGDPAWGWETDLRRHRLPGHLPEGSICSHQAPLKTHQGSRLFLGWTQPAWLGPVNPARSCCSALPLALFSPVPCPCLASASPGPLHMLPLCPVCSCSPHLIRRPTPHAVLHPWDVLPDSSSISSPHACREGDLWLHRTLFSIPNSSRNYTHVSACL